MSMAIKPNQDWGASLVSGWSYNGNHCNGNVELVSFTSDPVKSDGLIHRASGVHTLQVHTINLNGNIQLLGTLDKEVTTQTDWIPVNIVDVMTSNVSNVLVYTYSVPTVFDRCDQKTLEINSIYTITGQYSWLKAYGSNIARGAVESIKISF